MAKMSVSWQEVAEVHQKGLQAIDFKSGKKGCCRRTASPLRQ